MVYSGLAGLRWRLLPHGLYCFNFHRIGDSSRSPFDRGVFSCTTEVFERVVILLKQRFDIVTLPRLADLADRGASMRRPPALITFDDGYLDNFTEAVPVLERHGVTGVFFLATSYVDHDPVPWWDEIAWCVRHARTATLRLSGVEARVALDGGERDEAVRTVLKIAKRRASVPIHDTVAEIRSATGAPPLTEAARGGRLFVSWDNVRAMAASGHDIGSHTVSHQLLAHLSAPDQARELSDSKRRIEQEIGRPVSAVAYPVGGHGAFTAETCRLAKDAGYRFGFSFLPGCNRFPLQDAWALRRLAVHNPASMHAVKISAGFPSFG